MSLLPFWKQAFLSMVLIKHFENGFRLWPLTCFKDRPVCSCSMKFVYVLPSLTQPFLKQYLRKHPWTSKMAYWVKVFAAQAGHLRLVSGTYCGMRKLAPRICPLTSMCAFWHSCKSTCKYTHAHAHAINKIKINKSPYFQFRFQKHLLFRRPCLYMQNL